MRDMIEDLHLLPDQVITRQQVIAWFHKLYPKIKARTVAEHLTRASTNAPSRLHHKLKPDGSDDLFFKIDVNSYRVYVSLTDPTPITFPLLGKEDEVMMQSLGLDPRVAAELQLIYDRLDAEEKLPSNAQLDAAYGVFQSRFSPDRLQGMDGEDLLLHMHSRGDSSSLVYWLEFKNDEEFQTRLMGSIAGGNAHKFGLFFRQEKSAWISGTAQNPKEISLAEAIAIAHKQRDELVAGAELLARLPAQANDQDYLNVQAQMNEVAPTVGDSAWGHKYFSLLFPEKVDNFHSPDYQRFHLIRLLQTPPASKGRYVNGGRFVAAATELGMRMNTLNSVINERDSGNPYRYWRIGTTEGASGPSQWEEMKRGGYIAIGWDAIGDLSEIRSNPDNTQRKSAIRDLLLEHRSDKYLTSGSAGNAVGHLHRFLMDIQEHDLILAADGAKTLGVGRVGGPYYYASEGRFRHRLPVDWLSLDLWSMPDHEHLLSTVGQLGKFPANLVEAESRILGAQAPPREQLQSITPAVPSLTGIPAQISKILERKGQMILFGPPGTGKTHWAEIAARELASRSWFQKAFDQLSETERGMLVGTEQQPLGAIRTCSFHPAYGYEDFLEGYRPESVDGRMVFQLRNGIFKRLCEDAAAQPNRDFFLIIDEINRGDIPRIFGELLTVMEKNKRGKCVLLPLTGSAFRVPPNVRIIGTMNTADRSIALLDAALRRRFGFLELMPDSKVLGQARIGALPLRPWFDALNENVVRHSGRDGRNLQIGHSYLLSDTGQPLSDILSFASVLAEDIIPLLQEYCYEDYATLELILGNSLVDKVRQRVRAELFSSGNGDELIQAVLAHYPNLTTYTAVTEGENGEGDTILEEEDHAEAGDEESDVMDQLPGVVVGSNP